MRGLFGGNLFAFGDGNRDDQFRVRLLFFHAGGDAALFHDVQAFAEAVEEDAHVLEDEGAAGFRSGICGGSKEGIYAVSYTHLRVWL